MPEEPGMVDVEYIVEEGRVVDFNVTDPGSVVRVALGADYDDAFIAWINGTEVYRSIRGNLDPEEFGWLDEATRPIGQG